MIYYNLRVQVRRGCPWTGTGSRFVGSRRRSRRPGIHSGISRRQHHPVGNSFALTVATRLACFAAVSHGLTRAGVILRCCAFELVWAFAINAMPGQINVLFLLLTVLFGGVYAVIEEEPGMSQVCFAKNFLSSRSLVVNWVTMFKGAVWGEL